MYELVSGWFIKRHQQRLGRKTTKSDLRTWELMTSGAAAGMAYNIVLFPADSVKSAMQTEDELRPAAAAGKGAKRRGFVQVAKEIYARRGLKGLYAGCGVTCLRSAPSSAMIFLIYETLEGHFGMYFA
jgi:ornithine carrier protein